MMTWPPSVSQRREPIARWMVIQAAAFGGVIVAGVVMATTSIRVPLICPLRALTGIPCPLCGMTTGTVASLRGDLAAAIAANPFSVGVVPAALAGLANRLTRLRSLGRPHRSRAWSRRATILTLASLAVGVALSWVSQLIRFDLL